MNKVYFLIGFRTTIGKQGYKVIDRFVATGLKGAKKEFERRNKLKRLSEKYNLFICKTEFWWS